MTPSRALLRCTALVVASCCAFAPSSSNLPRSQISLSVASTDEDITHLYETATISSSSSSSSRRSFLNTAITTASATLLQFSSPLPAFAEEDDAASSSSSKPKIQPLSTYIYNILRVREATQQETRLITSGKFKDVQRANVKLAIKFIINNYKLSDSIIAASSYLKGNARVQASGVGQSAVQSLYTIVEYFDSSDVENIKVDSLAGKEAIVNSGLKSVRRDIDELLSMFPKDVVDEAKAKIQSENELNYKEFDPKLGSILNPNP
mmetsp:Transcript_17331/g.31334  ORF Transcript_17331/g.31334 Transcript_17331/m.31334 type:complete len:264 (-) Transcript_17331:443-1234(-)|eukprot:CAMPEP_0201629182 /NCGR_PEP_ID=MMETSP0493-20130528/3924_1 /ASSEMBLY_ACC=CAM_ASM_000838 /TAXON_ID=420259 /ORGANISM="Thalassiosira gravida, Strain GMp14c1" /LENGTH=263 /DNA_ID=CAMNT_0048100125 /DNA_START=36 /DNA_END=827 /DNA_ORIENTATION=-